MPVTVGQIIPELTFLNADGSTLKLRSLLGKPVLLVFLRHLA